MSLGLAIKTASSASEGQNVPSTLKREKAVMGLLEQPTLEKAAQAAGIGLRTLKRWLTDAAFQELLRKAKCDALADATAKLRLASGRAVAVLDAIANNPEANSASRVSAARAILELGLECHFIEEIEMRILALERQGRGEKISFS